MHDYFSALGARVDEAWRCASCDERAFPRLAADALSAMPPAQYTSVGEIASWLLEPRRHIEQPPVHPFGQPPVSVFQGADFRIEALFWRESTTSIHQHSFAGAFCLLHGSSLHTSYEFTETARTCWRFRIGHLRAQDSEVLTPNAVRLIEPGSAFIHQVAHLELPSVTIVVRTKGLAEYQPQLRYELPGIALDNELNDPTLSRQRAIVELLITSKLGDPMQAIRSWIEGSEPRRTMELIAHVAPLLSSEEQDEVVGLLCEHHGEMGRVMAASCHHRRRVHTAIAVRSRTASPATRALVALLMLEQPLEHVREVLALVEPEAGHDALEHGLIALAKTGLLGAELDEFNRDLLTALARGATPATLLSALSDTYDTSELMQQGEQIMAHAHALCSLPLLAPLFRQHRWSSSEAARLGRKDAFQ